MIGWVTAMAPADYQAWLSGGIGGRHHGRGRREAVHRPRLHHLPPRQRPGPRAGAEGRLYGKQVLLSGGQTVTMDDAYIRESILNPQAKVVAGFQPIMPTFQGLVSEEQLLQLIAYVKSLSEGPAPAPATPPHGRRHRRRRRSNYGNHREHP